MSTKGIGERGTCMSGRGERERHVHVEEREKGTCMSPTGSEHVHHKPVDPALQEGNVGHLQSFQHFHREPNIRSSHM